MTKRMVASAGLALGLAFALGGLLNVFLIGPLHDVQTTQHDLSTRIVHIEQTRCATLKPTAGHGFQLVPSACPKGGGQQSSPNTGSQLPGGLRAPLTTSRSSSRRQAPAAPATAAATTPATPHLLPPPAGTSSTSSAT